jgi:hypothetical protein
VEIGKTKLSWVIAVKLQIEALCVEDGSTGGANRDPKNYALDQAFRLVRSCSFLA